MPSIGTRLQRRGWPIAIVLSACLHVLCLIALVVLSPFLTGNVEARKPEPIQIELIHPPETQEPSVYSHLPEDRAREKPEHADILSNVASRAADRVAGGNQSMPQLEGTANIPAVPLQAGRRAPVPSSDPPDPRDLREGRESNPENTAALGTQRSKKIVTENELVRRARASALLLARPEGNSDFFQPGMAPGGNATSFGDISLNTTAWDYAPWLENFRRELMQHWYAPGAYYYGVLRDGGFAVIEVEISKSGQMMRMDLLEEKEHVSLTAASMGALKSTAPFEALPRDFPETTLILRIQMIYPKIERR